MVSLLGATCGQPLQCACCMHTRVQAGVSKRGASLMTGGHACRRFTNSLALMVWISVAWIAYEMYFKVTDQYNEKWQYDWITSDFW